MAFSLKDLQAARAALPPVPVKMSWMDEPLLIHQFTINDIKAFDSEAADIADQEHRIRYQIIKLLNGPLAKVTQEDCDSLGEIFTGWQIREIFHKGLKLNGQGPEALREAEKN